jgi:hypothetical protein
MAERLISPGVFTKENDLSFLPQGIAEIGAAFIGPFSMGPAFRPVIVESLQDYQAQFGNTTSDYYTPYAVESYLKQAQRATIVRVLGLAGYDSAVNQSLRLTISGSTSGVRTVALLHPSRLGVSLLSGSVSGSPNSFNMTISGSSGLTTFTGLSLNPTSANYYVNVLGTSPVGKYDGFVLEAFDNATAFVPGYSIGSGSMQLALASGDLNFSGSIYGVYSNAYTPMIRTQLLGGQRYNLFQFFTLSDGNTANDVVKVSITDIMPPSVATEYGTFTVLVRDLTDTDSKINVLEQFTNCTLDPTSPDYVAQKIGTARTIIDASGFVYLEGDWPNNSKYIRVAMSPGSDNVPINGLPYGFAPMSAPLNRADVPAPDYVTTRYYTPTGTTTAISNDRLYYGLNTATNTTKAYLNALPSGSSQQVGQFWSGSSVVPAGGADPGFDLLTTLATQDLTDISVTTATALRKFTVGFQGGFDGQNFAVVRNTGTAITPSNTMGFNLSTAGADGARAYNTAIQAVSNPDEYDINMLVTPGVIYSQHVYVVTQGIAMVENRADAFYVFDADSLGNTVLSAINAIVGLDTSYAATYHPWLKIRDTNTGKTLWAPPSVLLPGVYAFNDRVGAEFFAPAGLTRGGLSEALQVRARLASADRDNLYLNSINPIAFFPGQGIVVWGQKTLQQAASALDRINVRRLLIMIKKFVASTARYLVFEQNTEATRNRFLSIVNPYLANIQERQGLYAFKVVMDSTNNTPDTIDRNILVGQLYLQPTKTAEFITLEFNILPTGATFPQ